MVGNYTNGNYKNNCLRFYVRWRWAGRARVWPSNGRFLFFSLLSTQRSKSPDWGSRRQPFKISLFVGSARWKYFENPVKYHGNTVEIQWKYGGNKYFGQRRQWQGWGLLIKSILPVNHFKPSSSLTAPLTHSYSKAKIEREVFLARKHSLAWFV